MDNRASRVAWWVSGVAVFAFVAVTVGLMLAAGVNRLLNVPFWFDTLFFQYNVFLLLLAIAIEPFLAWSYLAIMKEEKERRLYQDLGPELWQQHEQKIHEYLERQFAARSYLPSVVAMMTVVALGGIVLLIMKPAQWGEGVDFLKGANLLVLGPFVEEIENGTHYHYVIHSLTGISFGFLGAYLYSLTQLTRAYFTVDLTPNTFIAATVRIISASVMTLVASFIFILAPEAGAMHERVLVLLPIIGFAFGYFPDWALRAIKQTALKAIGEKVEGESYGSTSLRLVSGMSDLHAARMEREGCDNVENLAICEPLELAIRTGFSYRQVRMWIGEACLRTELTVDFEPFVAATGIRTHSQLLAFSRKWQAEVHDEPAAAFLARAAAKPGLAGKLTAILMIAGEPSGTGAPRAIVPPPTEPKLTIAKRAAAEPPRKDWQEERGGRIDPLAKPTPDFPLDDDERIDQAIAESFPASDPPSWNGGID
ncbi:MAG TPA: hypothetical protein VJ276_17575 [Thermoanaerobaculia bacterium]|nr:hypothetical protein [Thermoanaerobaculia bacterium]